MKAATQKFLDRVATRLEAVLASLQPAVDATRPFLPVAAPVLLLAGVLWLLGTLPAGAALALMAVTLIGVRLAAVQAASRNDVTSRGGATSDFARRYRRQGADDWRMLVDAMPEAALVLDVEGHVLHHNAAAMDLIPNIKTEQPLSRAVRNPSLMTAIDRASETGKPIAVTLVERIPVERRTEATVSILTRSGKNAASPAPGVAAPAMLITFRDLSEQDKLAQMREDFIANASHELRTPLASLKGFLETLQGPARDDVAARDRFLGLMASQADRMSRLIDDLLSLSRVEMRAHLPPRGIVDLNEVTAYAIQTLEPLAESAGAEVRLFAHETPARIRGDRDQIVQVVLNLAQNAILHGGTNGPVDVHISRRPAISGGTSGKLSIAVSDQGRGIAPEHIPRLTERFYRVNVASSRAKGGTGLGLAIVKHIVARHRGDLDIVSKPGQGSTFTVTFDELHPAHQSRDG